MMTPETRILSKILLISVFLLFSQFASAQWLKVSDNHRFLVRDDGSPFFWLADTGWEMFHRLDRGEIDYYLRNRASKGFTVIQAVLLSEINGLTVANEEGHLPLKNLDPAQPDEDYFKLVDYAVKKAADYGIYLALLPSWGSHLEDKAHPLFDNVAIFDVKNAEVFGHFLGNRYQDDWNVIWVLGGDRPPTGYEMIWNAMAKGLGSGGKHRHLVSYHPMGQQSSAMWFQDSEWLDFNMVQTGHLQPDYPVYDWITKDYERTPVKPILNGEPAYEDIGYLFNTINGRYNDYQVRKYAYWSVFAGAFGHTYDNNNVWQMYKEKHQPVIRADVHWDLALEHPGGGQMQYLRKLMLSRPFLTRIPDQSILRDENPSYSSDHKRITRDGTPGKDDATYIMVYLPYFSNLTIDTRVIAGETLRIWWYNPRTGEGIPVGTRENTGTFTNSFWSNHIKNTQGGPDWVVVIDDAEKNYPSPGIPIY